MNNNQNQNPKVIPFGRDDLILERLKDLRDGQRELKTELQTTKRELKTELQTTKRELNARMDKLDARVDRLENNFNDRFDKIENEIRNSTRHGHIMTASVVGIALAVIYFVATH